MVMPAFVKASGVCAASACTTAAFFPVAKTVGSEIACWASAIACSQSAPAQATKADVASMRWAQYDCSIASA